MTADTDTISWDEAASLILPDGIPLPKLMPDIGWRVRTVGDHHIEIRQMLFNFRLVEARVDERGDRRGWCYSGRDAGSFMTAVLAAWAWDGSADTEPPCYDKRAF